MSQSTVLQKLSNASEKTISSLLPMSTPVFTFLPMFCVSFRTQTFKSVLCNEDKRTHSKWHNKSRLCIHGTFVSFKLFSPCVWLLLHFTRSILQKCIKWILYFFVPPSAPRSLAFFNSYAHANKSLWWKS